MFRLIGLVACLLAFSLSGCSKQDVPPPANTATSSRVADEDVLKDQVRPREAIEEQPR